MFDGDDDDHDDSNLIIDDGSSHLQARRQAANMKRLVYVLGALCVALGVVIAVMAAKNKNSNSNGSSSSSSADDVCLDASCVMNAAVVLNGMDQSVDPCDNFYQYACGGWEEKHDIPDDSASYSSFSVLYNDNLVKLRHLLDTQPNTTTYKSPMYYKACMDDTARDTGSVDALKSILATYHSTATTFTEKMAALALLDVSPFLGIGVGIDDLNASKNNIFMSQAGLGLPDPDYYKYKTVENDTILSAYSDYIAAASQYVGATVAPEDVIAVENMLADIFIPQDQLRDPVALYNEYSVSTMQASFNFMDWTQFLSLLYTDTEVDNATAIDSVIISTPKYFESLSSLFPTLSETQISSYMEWRLVSRYFSVMDNHASTLRQALKKAIYGVSDPPPKWEVCVSATDGALGFELGRLFVDAYFKEDAKQKIDGLIEGIRSAFLDRLTHVGWMDEDTKIVAKEKAEAVEQKIGYPDFIKNNTELAEYYKSVNVGTLYFDNYKSVVLQEVRFNFDDYFRPPDKSRWGMTPPTVNAYYSPSENEIVFPAGILQSPFFSPSQADSINFGGIGVVIGHELSHGFDDQGRQYDKDGDLRQWWSNATVDQFKERAQCFIDQYDGFLVNGEHVNGELTLGENIADNGGVHTAYTAFKTWQMQNGVEKSLPGISLNPDQLFFVGFAQVWCSKFRPEEAHNRLLTDVHSPAKYRVIGSVSNTMDFANAFSCPAQEDTMCRLW